MTNLFEWLSNNFQVVTVIATVVIAVSAIATTCLTVYLVKENRTLRKIGYEPKIIAYLSVDENCVYFFNFSLANVGRGPAKNIKYNFHIEEHYIGQDRVGFVIDRERKPIGFLGQDEKITTFFGSGIGLLGDDTPPPFKATVEWENLKGSREKGEYELDVRQFLGFSSVPTSPENEIAISLKNISEQLDSITSPNGSGNLRVETRTQSREISNAKDNEE